MPAPTMPTGVHAIGPGYLFWAPIGTAEPASTVAASVFSDVWAGAWVPVGYTDDGHVFTYASTVDQADAAESLDPLAYATTGRTASFAFSPIGMTAANLKRALNGGTSTLTGTGATTKTVYNPPDP
ncbi:MAG TPA: hypothetical protein VJX66_32055, partial [Amycolatopsis sp.]|nr:hypothetical protein [Amycolatopsis sp.]